MDSLTYLKKYSPASVLSRLANNINYVHTSYFTIIYLPSIMLMFLCAVARRRLQTHQWCNPIIKWETAKWGELPADFGRK